jgi:hypothetical protein
LQVLHLLLFRLTAKPYDEQLLEFLAVDEHLVDIGDDLVDYEVGAPRWFSGTACAWIVVPRATGISQKTPHTIHLHTDILHDSSDGSFA